MKKDCFMDLIATYHLSRIRRGCTLPINIRADAIVGKTH